MNPLRRGAAVAVGVVALAAFTDAPARAHPLAPSLLALEERGAGELEARLSVPRVGPAGRIEVRLPERCRPASELALRAEPDRLVSEQRFDCGAEGLAGAEVAVLGLAETSTDLLLHVARASGRSQQALLSAQRPALRLPARTSAAREALDYARLGAEHMAAGLDHLLFVAGLFLLGGGARRLLATLTAFTLGHSATLSLVALGVASPPGALVEIGIAASLVVQALALASRSARPGLLERRPGLLAAGFGLLHGMGFAGALRQVGLPEDAVVPALLAFNVGIEAAQLAFVALLSAAALALPSLRAGTARWPAHALGGLGAFLVLDRLSGWLAH